MDLNGDKQHFYESSIANVWISDANAIESTVAERADVIPGLAITIPRVASGSSKFPCVWSAYLVAMLLMIKRKEEIY